MGDLTYESAAYVARYVMKKMSGKNAVSFYRRVSLSTGEIYSLVPPFTRMSLKPGIGSSWFEKYWKDVYPLDAVVLSGRRQKPPRYYDRKVAEALPDLHADVQYERFERAKLLAKDCTPERLAVRELVARAKGRNLLRCL